MYPFHSSRHVAPCTHRYQQLVDRRESRRRALAAVAAGLSEPADAEAVAALVARLETAESAEEIDDVEARYRLLEESMDETQARLAQLSVDDGSGGRRRPQKSSKFKQFRSQGLYPFVANLGVPAALLAENLEKGYREHEAADPPVAPIQVRAAGRRYALALLRVDPTERSNQVCCVSPGGLASRAFCAPAFAPDALEPAGNASVADIDGGPWASTHAEAPAVIYACAGGQSNRFAKLTPYPRLNSYGALTRTLALPPMQAAEAFLYDQSLDESRFTADSILHAATVMAATEIAAEPAIRAHVRAAYNKAARLTATPTDDGERVIDPFHKYGAIKRLRNKPLYELETSDAYLRLRAAEREGLLTVKIEMPAGDEGDLLGHLRELYCNTNVSVVSQAWNQLREQVRHAPPHCFHMCPWMLCCCVWCVHRATCAAV